MYDYSCESFFRFQYMPRGSLFDLLHGAAGVVVDTAQAVRFALDIARGMAFLHSLERIIPEYYLNSLHVMVGHLWENFQIVHSIFFHSQSPIRNAD